MQKVFVFVLVGFVFCACRKDETPPLMKIKATNLRFPVNSGIQPPFTYYIPINNVRLNALPQLVARGIDTTMIHSIRPSRAVLSVVFGESTLDFIEAVSIRLCKQGDNQDNCGQEVFYRDPVPFRAGTDLDLVPSSVGDIRKWVLLEALNIQVKLERLRDFPRGTFEVNLDLEFDVH